MKAKIRKKRVKEPSKKAEQVRSPLNAVYSARTAREATLALERMRQNPQFMTAEEREAKWRKTLPRPTIAAARRAVALLKQARECENETCLECRAIRTDALIAIERLSGEPPARAVLTFEERLRFGVGVGL